MSTVVVLVVVVFLIAAALGGGEHEVDPRASEQLRRDTEDIAAYGVVIRPRLPREDPDAGDGAERDDA